VPTLSDTTSIPLGRLVGVQYLRAVAALMVVYYHAVRMVPQFKPHLSLPLPLLDEGLAAGVHVFFVISGFIMLATTTRSRPVDFLARRVIRIVPLYWLLTGLLALSVLVVPNVFRQTVLTPEAFVKSALFIAYTDAHGTIAPLVAAGWTLNIEMFFYGVFALGLLVSFERRLALVAALLIALVFAGIPLSLPQAPPELWQITRPWMLEFVLGMLIARWWLKGVLRRVPVVVCHGLIFIGFVGLLTTWTSIFNDEADWVLPSALIVLGTVALDQARGIKQHRGPMLLGDASYSIYLSHFFTLAVIKSAWVKLGLTQRGGWAYPFALVAVAASIVVAVVTYRIVEKPLLDGLQSWYRRRREVTPVPATARDLSVP
jgi:exopolysaccharide production protein ExoZ